MKKWLILTLLIILLAAFSLANYLLPKVTFRPTTSNIPTGINSSLQDVEVIAGNLNIPWEIAFLPDGSMLVTERPGNIKRVDNNKIIDVKNVYHRGEAGLLGLAIHPDFANNNYIYIYLTADTPTGIVNRIERYKLINDILQDRKIILDNIPASEFHDGGRIKFGPDSFLYITTGDAGQEELAQDKNSLAGKILRIKDDGSLPDNPFKNEVYSYGHRNSQGLAWDDAGNLWATEHGRSGVQSGLDELNLILPGNNYGWPVIQGDESRKGMETPIINSGSLDTWAPAAAVFYKDSIFFTGLRGQALYQAVIKDGKVTSIKQHS